MIAKVNTNVQQNINNNNSIVVQLVLKNSYLPLQWPDIVRVDQEVQFDRYLSIYARV